MRMVADLTPRPFRLATWPFLFRSFLFCSFCFSSLDFFFGSSGFCRLCFGDEVIDVPRVNEEAEFSDYGVSRLRPVMA